MLAVALVAIIGLVVLGLLWWWVRRRWQPGNEDAEPGWYFSIEDKHVAVHQLCSLLAGEGTWLMLEGDFRPAELSKLVGATSEVPEGLRRHTIWSFPKEKVAALPLREGHTDELDLQLAPLLDRVTHLQIARNGALDFGAYDSFEFAWASDRVPEGALRELEARGVLLSLRRTPDEW